MELISNDKNVFVLGLWECFGEMSIYGVYTDKLKLIEAYNYIVTDDISKTPYFDGQREVCIYGFPLNDFIGETPEWNDGRLWSREDEYKITIKEVQKNVKIYDDGCFEVYCNFNINDVPTVRVRYIGGSIEDIFEIDINLETGKIEGEYDVFFESVLKAWYTDNKASFYQIWKEIHTDSKLV